MSSLSHFQLPDDQKFNGLNYNDFNLVWVSAIVGRGLGGYFLGTVNIPANSHTAAAAAASTTTAATPFYKEYIARNAYIISSFISNCKDVCALTIKTDGTAKELWDSVKLNYGTASLQGRLNAKKIYELCTLSSNGRRYGKDGKVELGKYLADLAAGLGMDYSSIFNAVMTAPTVVQAEQKINLHLVVINLAQGSSMSVTPNALAVNSNSNSGGGPW
ncbi:hypothetical protein C8J56DRAFT_1057311 [Mycena floridula]|nr:hypothetical protein C8J56DRAFT_1057311 [Mycena floridula]